MNTFSFVTNKLDKELNYANKKSVGNIPTHSFDSNV